MFCFHHFANKLFLLNTVAYLSIIAISTNTSLQVNFYIIRNVSILYNTLRDVFHTFYTSIVFLNERRSRFSDKIWRRKFAIN